MTCDFKYRSGEGLFADDELLAEFNPQVTRKKIYTDLHSGEKKISYKVTVTDLNGNVGEEVELSDFSNISYFKEFGCPDGCLTKSQRSLLEYKLQMESKEVPVDQVLILRPGLQFYNDAPLFVLGDQIITPGSFKEEMVIHEANPIPAVKPSTCVKEEAKNWITLLPGVTEIIFYGALFAVLKPFLDYWGIKSDFLFAVVGPSGHLKTTLTSLYTLWMEESERQMTTFRSTYRTDALMKQIQKCDGSNFLMDDLHQAKSSYRKAKQGDQLDMVIRNMPNQFRNTNIWVTGESMEDMDIFSCQDRMLQIRIPKMDAEHINMLKQEVSSLDKNSMCQAALLFANVLVRNMHEVQKDVCSYYEKHSIAGSDSSTSPIRLHRHRMFIEMTEYLYRKHICNLSSGWSCHKELEEALDKQYAIQEKELLKLRKREEKRDYVIDVFEMLNADGKYLVALTDPKDYQAKEGEGEFLIWNNRYYIRKNVLQKGLMEYFGEPVPINDVINALDNAGCLDKERDSRSKHFAGTRCYVIFSPLIKKYYEMKKTENQ